MNRKVLISIIVATGAVLAAAGALYIYSEQPETPVTTTKPSDETATPPPVNISKERVAETTIVYTNDGFKPSTTTIKKGSAITVVNNSSVNVIFSSADHPTHEEQPELNMEMLRPNESGTITPIKVGTWGYHDHIDESKTGSIIVTE